MVEGAGQAQCGQQYRDMRGLGNYRVHTMPPNNTGISAKQWLTATRRLLRDAPWALLSHIYWHRGSPAAAGRLAQFTARCCFPPMLNCKRAVSASSQTRRPGLPAPFSAAFHAQFLLTSSSLTYHSSHLAKFTLPAQLAGFTHKESCFLPLFKCWFQVTFAFPVQWSHSDGHHVH